ncbi:uncharacterized protein B0I36DRAFT_313053 [Microdochium trichocladiopsis]|uniref:Uncharacterized protein n=1 Tax=Microdochium trichocladiopsis TaxID=1682393 RepID=A0A9P8YM57_9PEZI|nr:uncharacterized protein B0I36DRAFT_313053 [Microdochium trichocladiopsis]KAH7041574.1 hypothetical protein B0I36DRAFT_313053 [Microdochium trichocladiopsis]
MLLHQIEALPRLSIRLSSLVLIGAYASLLYNLSQYMEVNDQLRPLLHMCNEVIRRELSPSSIFIFLLVYCHLPIVSIFAPRATTFLEKHRVVFAMSGAGYLLYWAPTVEMSIFLFYICLSIVMAWGLRELTANISMSQ